MTLNVEDGTGLSNANAYVSVADADAYFTLRGISAWTGDDATKEAAIARATAALDTKYRGRWIGQKAHSTQRLAWPRAATVDGTETLTDPDGAAIAVNVVPEPVLDACCEVALIELVTPRSFLATSVTREQMVKRKKVDVLETEYFEGAPTIPLYPHIDQLLSGYCGTSALVLGVSVGLTDDEAKDLRNYNPYSDPAYFNIS